MSRVTGQNSVNQWLQSRLAEFTAELKEAVEVNTGDMEMQAIRNAPTPGGKNIATRNGQITEMNVRNKTTSGQKTAHISQAIGYKITPDGLKGTVFVEKSAGDVAAYVEFGTGQDASAYLATLPQEWREEARRFYVNGKGTIINKPYLYPAYIKYRTEFLKEVKDLVKRYSSR